MSSVETSLVSRPIAIFCIAMMVCASVTLNSQLVGCPASYAAALSQVKASGGQNAPTFAQPPAHEVSYLAGVAQEKRGVEDCVDWYVQAAAQSWQILEANRFASLLNDQHRELEFYNMSVAKLVNSAQTFGKFDPNHGVKLASGSILPMRFSKMTFGPSEISRIEVVGQYKKTQERMRRHGQNGIGVPVICHVKTERKFMEAESTIVATAILRSSDAQPERFFLEIVNSKEVREILVEQKNVPLAFDLTAALAYTKSSTPKLEGVQALFKKAELDGRGGLKMIEPYQPGKIPVVLIHGFASNPLTWKPMLNDIFVHRDIVERYQFWTFYYPTGKPFPAEAANLRKQISEIRDYLDPQLADGSLNKMVVAGHSLGGLVAKMQITESQSELLDSLSKVPIEELNLHPESRSELSRLFQFSPSKQISRVVFIGTPHGGTKRASNLPSHITARLIKQPRDLEYAFDELRKRNVDLLKSKTNRTPTSLDLMQPGNSFLDALYELPVAPHIRMHSIIGTGQKGHFSREAGDGVVLVSSAQHRDVASEIMVNDDHSMQKHPKAIEEVIRILRVNMNEAENSSWK